MTSACGRIGMKPSIWFLFAVLFVSTVNTVEKKTNVVKKYREVVKNMFYHAYNGYIHHAYPYDELRPLTCDGHDTWGSYSLTLIDALDTLAVMGNYTEFQRVCHLLMHKAETFFDMDINVSVFETNIRVVGGLLSAHLLMKRAGMVLEPGWPCSGPLLRMAEHVARKLLPAFDTPTGMPYGTVNLRHGVPKGETTVTCTAGVGTFIVEFGALSRLTGDPVYEKVAMRAIRALWNHRSPIGLLGNHVDVATGKWTALDSGIGGGMDSYFEYLVKGAIMFNIPELLEMFREYQKHIEAHVKRDDWYLWANMKKGGITLPLFTSLDAYWPGVLSMLGDLDSAMKTLHNFHQVWRQFGSTPEFYNIPKAEVHQGREGYPLRPELIESIMYLYRATRDPFLLSAGVDIVEAIERIARTSCGYATVKDVRDHSLENRMESFFLAETAKYLYLLFDPDNFLHNNGSHGQLVHTPNGDCVIDSGGYVFNTEAHPIDLAAVHCCSAQKQEEEESLRQFHNSLNLMELLDIVHDTESRIVGKKLKKKKKGAASGKVGVRVSAKDGRGSCAEDGECESNAVKDEECKSKHDDESEMPDKVNTQDSSHPKGPGGKQDVSVKKETQMDTISSSSSSSSSFSSSSSSSSSSLPRASIKTKVMKSESTAPGKLPQSQDIVEETSSQESGHGMKVTTQAESGRQKHTIDLAQQILELFSSISKPPVTSEEEKRVPNIGDLYQSVANYSTVYEQKPLLMRCPKQAFHHRLSVWGEMFDDV